MKFTGIKCSACGKKGLSYASHPHAFGYKDTSRVVCRYCNGVFNAEKVEARAARERVGKR